MSVAKTTRVVKYIRKGETGEKGDMGATLRGPQAWSDCAVGYSFYKGAAGEAWKDVVLYNNNYYVCTKSHTKTSSNYPGSTTSENQGLWQLGDRIALVASDILLTTYALVKNLGVETIDMKDGQGNILFQAKNGNVTCKTGTFENVNITGKLKGSVRNPFVSAGDSFDTDYGDNVAMLSSGGGWVWAYSLPWDAGQSGRKITIANCFWNGSNSYGAAGISAPSGKYFYENGEKKTELQLNREIVELIGYGTSTTFYGWIVLSRDYVTPTYKYGRPLRCLAMGRVTGRTSNGTCTVSATTFDGGTITASRTAQGLYTVNMPSSWFSSADHVHVMLTGVGNELNNSSADAAGLIKATLKSRTSSSFVVGISDDASGNDGSFDFMIFNRNDWA